MSVDAGERERALEIVSVDGRRCQRLRMSFDGVVGAVKQYVTFFEMLKNVKGTACNSIGYLMLAYQQTARKSGQARLF